MTKHNSTVIGLDIGSAKTTLCVGALDALDRVEIFNLSMVRTRGMERGVITNLGEVAECVEEVIRKAENKLSSRGRSKSKSNIDKKKIKIHSVCATISGEHIIGNNAKGVLNLSSRPVEISQQDTQRAIDSAKSCVTSIERDILHALAREFIVNGNQRIKNPLGVYGRQLAVNLHIISCDCSFANSLIKAINRAGLDVNGIIYSGLATSLVTLTEPEKQAGVISLELGAGTTNVLFFNEGVLQYTSVIPIGGNDITLEISRRLGIDFFQAEQLKMQYQSAASNYKGSLTDKIIIKKTPSSYESITREDLVRIIDEKLEQLLGRIKKDLELSGICQKVNPVREHDSPAGLIGNNRRLKSMAFSNGVNCGIVICGGMAFMDGIIEKLEQTLAMPVRLGIVRGFVSNLSGLNNISHATGIGLIMHILNERKQNYKTTLPAEGIWPPFIAKLRTIYEEYF